jgi:hypothetical protein
LKLQGGCGEEKRAAVAGFLETFNNLPIFARITAAVTDAGRK